MGGITPIDGPVGDSVIGSVDNVFKAIKDYDQFRCIERMICEAMSEQSDIPGLDGLVSAITGEDTAPQTLASTFGGGRPPSSGGSFLDGLTSGFLGGGGSRPPLASGGSGGGSFLDSLDNLIFGSRRRESRPPPPPPNRPFRPQNPRPQPQRFRQTRPRPQRPRPFPSRRQDNLVHEDDFKPSRRIRAKRQTRLQGNIIRYNILNGLGGCHE